LPDCKNVPVGQVKQDESFVQVPHFELQVKQAPSLKNFPSGHPGLQTPEFKRNPSLHPEHSVKLEQAVQLLGHEAQTPLLL
jgi:hypothetical protein